MKFTAKFKTLLLLTFCVASQPKKECLEWFPEPVGFKTPDRNEKFHSIFNNVRDLIEEKNDKLSVRLEEFVIDSMDAKSTGIRSVNSIVLNYLPSIRQLFIAILCIAAAEIIFIFAWNLSLFESISELIESSEFIEKYRIGLSILPLLFVVGIIVTYSNMSPSFHNVSDGLDTIETGNDRSFMPIKTRIRKKLDQVPCVFRRDYRNWKWSHRRTDSFLNETIGGVSFDSHLNSIWKMNGTTNSEACSVLENSLMKSAKTLNSSIVFQELFDEKQRMTEHFMDLIEAELNKTLNIYAKALVSVESFVAEYHQNVLFLPSMGLIQFVQLFVQVMIVVTLFFTLCVTVLVVIKFNVKSKIGQWFVTSPVFILSTFSVICMLISVTLLLRISFTLIVREEVMKDDFALFGKLKVRNFSENNQHYRLNYTDILNRAARVNQTLYQVIRELHPSGIPVAIRPEFVFRPNELYNASVVKTADLVVNKYPGYVEKACEVLNSTWHTMKSHVEMGQCTEKENAEKILEIVNETFQSACSLSEYLKKSPPDSQKIHKMAFATWKKQMLPPADKGMIRRSTMMDSTNPLQVYFVFENPEKKLEHTILEPLFGIAVYTLVMAPLQFLLAIHFMIVLPLLTEQVDDVSVKGKEEQDDVSVVST